MESTNISIKEASELIGYRQRDIRRAIKVGELNCTKNGRYYLVDREELVKWEAFKSGEVESV